MATYYFNNKGEPATPFTVSGEEMVSKGRGIKAIAPEGIEAWRLSYNLSTKVVDVKFEGLSNEDAEVKLKTDSDTLAQTEQDAAIALANADKAT